MMNTTHTTGANERAIEHLALRRARAKLGWGLHAAVFLAVNTGLVALSLATGRHWAIYPLLGWGLGLAIHGLVTMLSLSGWRERAVEREIEALKRR